MPSVINANMGIERILPVHDRGALKALPESRFIPTEGGRVKDHLSDFFQAYRPFFDVVLENVRPKISEAMTTAPNFYARHLQAVVSELRVLVKEEEGEDPPKRRKKKKIASALNVIEQIHQDMELLDFYMNAMRKA